MRNVISIEMKRKILGKQGENIACEFLKRKGFEILERNFQRWGGEIDIISFDAQENELVFVEVKTRTNTQWQHLDETFKKRQYESIRKLAKFYLYITKREDVSWRIDHLGIILDRGKTEKIEHFKAIYF